MRPDKASVLQIQGSHTLLHAAKKKPLLLQNMESVSCRCIKVIPSCKRISKPKLLTVLRGKASDIPTASQRINARAVLGKCHTVHFIILLDHAHGAKTVFVLSGAQSTIQKELRFRSNTLASLLCRNGKTRVRNGAAGVALFIQKLAASDQGFRLTAL